MESWVIVSSYRAALGHFNIILFFHLFQVFSSYSCSMDWGALGELFISLGEILMPHYFMFWFKLYLFQFQKNMRSKYKKNHVKMLNIEEIVPFPHYLVVNQCNVDGFKWISKTLMVYGWMDCYSYIIVLNTIRYKYPKYFMYKC